jgi:hypothetical protein
LLQQGIDLLRQIAEIDGVVFGEGGHSDRCVLSKTRSKSRAADEDAA